MATGGNDVKEMMEQGWRRTEAGQKVLWTLFLVALCAFVFLGLSLLIGEQRIQEFDRDVLLALRQDGSVGRTIGPSWLQRASVDLTSLGSVAVLTLCTTAVVGFLLMRGSYRTALMLVIATLLGGAVGEGLKLLFLRSRPSVVPHLAEVSSASFPSGHSMMSAVVYMTLAVVAASTLEGRRERLYIVLVGLLVSGTVGFTRMMLGVHYPTDVMAGWTLGVGWALASWAFTRFLQREHVIEEPGIHEHDEIEGP